MLILHVPWIIAGSKIVCSSPFLCLLPFSALQSISCWDLFPSTVSICCPAPCWSQTTTNILIQPMSPLVSCQTSFHSRSLPEVQSMHFSVYTGEHGKHLKLLSVAGKMHVRLPLKQNSSCMVHHYGHPVYLGVTSSSATLDRHTGLDYEQNIMSQDKWHAAASRNGDIFPTVRNLQSLYCLRVKHSATIKVKNSKTPSKLWHEADLAAVVNWVASHFA